MRTIRFCGFGGRGGSTLRTPYRPSPDTLPLLFTHKVVDSISHTVFNIHKHHENSV